MTEKWNKRCGCNCPEDAHVRTAPRPYTHSWVESHCTATIQGDGMTWPCRCQFIEKSMVRGITCGVCGESVPLTKTTWLNDLGGIDGATAIQKELGVLCEGYGNHQPIHVGETTT